MAAQKEKLSLLLTASLPDQSRLAFSLSDTPRMSEEDEGEASDDEEEENEEEGRAEGGEGLRLERREERRRRRGEENSELSAWLSECIFDAWGSLEYLAVGRGRSLALMGRRGATFSLLFSKPIQLEPDEEISSVLLLGVPSKRVSGSIEGVVCLVGTSDGRLLIFTESALLLFSHRFAPDPVTALRTTVDSILLVSHHEMVLIDRKSLLTLVNETRKLNNAQKRPELEYVVLTRRYDDVTVDAVPVPFAPSTMDRYAECSMDKFHKKVERIRGDASFWLALNDNFAVSARWESERRERMRDTIVKWGANFLPSFMQTAMTSTELAPAATHAAVAWRPLCEPRFALSLAAAPRGVPLVAVADNLARVLLIETSTGQVVRVWKGYRDASCGWLTVGGEGGRTALFLTILAPRRNLLEIWSAPNGRRVAARQVRAVHLVQSSGEVLYDGRSEKGTLTEGEGGRLYLMGIKGNLYEITVAFESLLSLNTDDEQHDRLILNEVSDYSMPSLPPLVSTLKTASAKRMALISAIHSARGHEETVHVLEELGKTECLSGLCLALVHLCRTHARIEGFMKRERSMMVEDAEGAQGNERIEGVDEEGWRELERSMELCMPRSDRSCALDEPFSLADFITSFNLHTSPLKLSLPPDSLPFLSFLFSPLLEGYVELDEFECLCTSINIGQADLASLFCSFWQSAEALSSRHFRPALQLLGALLSTRPGRIEKQGKRRSGSTSSITPNLREAMEERAAKSTDALRGASLLALLAISGHEDVDRGEEEFAAVRTNVQRMEGILRAAPLLDKLSRLTAESPTTPLTVHALLESGPGLLREQVASLAVARRLLPCQLLEDPAVMELRAALPYTLEPSLVCAETAWTLLREWTGKSTFESGLLAGEYARAIEEAALRSACVALLWNASLLGALRAVANQSRGAERDVHAQLVPSHRVSDFVQSLFALLSSLVSSSDDDDRIPETLTSRRGRREEWMEGMRGGAGGKGLSKCESLSDVLQRQPPVDEACLHLHRQLLAAVHVTLSVGRSPNTARALFPARLHAFLYSNLATRAQLLEEVDDETQTRREALIEKACAYPHPAARDSLLFLCAEWRMMDAMQMSDGRRALREGRDDDGCLAIASLSSHRRIGCLVPAVAVRLKQLAVEGDVLLSARDEKTLVELAGDEFVDETSLESTRKLLGILTSISASAPATKQLTEIGRQYFGL